MVNTAPTPVDIVDFQFKLRYRLKVFQNEENDPFTENCSLIASASRFGLLFIGTCSPCFQVLQIQSLDKYTTKDGDITDYNRRTIPLPSQPKHLSVNCDCTKLCVVIQTGGCAKAIVYDITSFSKQNVSIIQEIRLTPTPGVTVIETCWNPAIPSVFSVCKSNGSLGIYELKGTGIEIMELPSTAGVTCMCWSPKGKQIAVGSSDGKITQFKPDLKAMRAVKAPVLEGAQSVVAMQWVSSYQFVAVYKSSNPDVQLNLIVVDFPRVGDTVYTNYEDICYSYGNTRPHQFYLMLQPDWNILMVASSNSMELGVLAFEKDHWTQWILPDSARAELPLSSTKQETLPVGMAFDTSSTQPQPWGETILSPMPLLFLLSHHGILCCFSAINVKDEVESICHSPEQLPDISGLSQFTPMTAVTPSKPVAINLAKQPTTVSFSQPAIQVTKTTVNPQIIITQPQSQLIFNAKPTLGLPFSLVNTSTPTKPDSQPSLAPFSLVNTSTPTKPDPQPLLGPFSLVNTSTPTKPDPLPSLHLKSVEQAENLVKPQQKPAVIKQPANNVKPNVIPQKLNQVQPAEVTVLNEDTETLIAQMVKEECAMLEMELMVLLQQGYELKVDMGNDNEATNLVQSTNSLEDFVNEATETSSSQAAEVHSLRQSLIQTWVWYEEARSRFVTFKDPKLIALLQAQPLDPASERQLADIRHLFYYIESQLNQANVALDEQWESFQDSCKKKLHLRMPSIETIYQSMVKQNATLQKQTYILKDLSNRVRRKHRDNQIPHLLVSLDNVDSLEEQLKNLHIQPSSVFNLQHERVLKRQKLLTKAKSDKLTNLLLNRKVVHVSVSKPQMPKVSMQLNSLIGEPFSPIAPNKKFQPQKLDFMQATPKTFVKPEPKTLASVSVPPETTKSQILTLNKPVVSTIEVSKSTGSAFFPTTQTLSPGIKPSGSNLFSSNNRVIITTSDVKPPPITTTAEQQKFFFSFNTPTTTVVATSTSAKTTASTNSTNIFTAPVTSSSTDGQKTSLLFKRTTASTSSPFSFQTLATDTTAKTSSSFTGFNFSTSQNSLLKVPPASPSLTKTSSAPTFGSPLIGAELSVSDTSLSSNSTTVKAITPVSSTITVTSVKPTPGGIKPESQVTFAALNSAPSVFGTKSYTAVPITSSSSGTAITDVKETSATITPLINTTEVAPVSSTETIVASPKPSIFSLGGEVSVIPITTGSIFSKPTTQASIFGGGVTSTTKSSIFGNGSAFLTSAPTFGKATVTTTPTSFGSNNQASIFATPATTTTAATSSGIIGSVSKPIFGSSTTSAFSTPKTSIFGAPATSTTSTFGAPVTSTESSVFSAPTTSSSLFNVSPTLMATSGFGTPTTTFSIFGGTSQSVFETPTTSVFSTPTTSAFGTSIFGAPVTSLSTSTFSTTTTPIFGAPTTTPTPITAASIFGTPTTSSVFSASTAPSIFGTPTSTTTAFGTPTTGVSFGTPTSTTTAFGTPTTGVSFGTPTSTTTIFGTPTTGVSVFATPTTSNVFSASTAPSAFGTSTTSSVFSTPGSIFGATPTTSSIFGATPTTSSIFGGNTTSSSIFGGAPTTSSVFDTSSTFGAPTNFFKPTASTTSVFGHPPAFSSGSIFSTPASTSSGSIFGNTASSNVFGTPTSSAPFGSSSTFRTSTTGSSPFGSSQTNSFSFAASAPANSSSSFGFNKSPFGFGNTPTNTESGSFNFGSLNISSPTTTAGSFGSGFGQAQNPFGSTSNEEQKSPFGGGNLFGMTPVTSSVFGGGSPFNKSTTAFGGPATFGSNQSFVQQTTFGQSGFGSGNVFGGSQPGPFSGGTQSVNQTGFGSSAAFAKPSNFGGPPAFGSTSPGSFGAPPAFGGSPVFGSTSVFGGGGKVFAGSPAPVDSFGSPGQQNATFANLANQQTLGFGSLAQQGQPPTTHNQQATGFSAGTSFSSWR